MKIFHIFVISIIISGSSYPAFALDTSMCDANSLSHYGPHNPSHIYIKDTSGNLPYIPLTDHTAIFHDDDVWNIYPEPRIIQVTLTIHNQDTGQLVFNQTQSLQMQACSGPESVKWRFVPIQIANYIATISDDIDKENMIFNSILDVTKSQTVSSPLEQLRFGIDSHDIVCKQDLQLVIKSEDGSPACVRPDTAQKLIERGLVTKISSNNYAVPTKILSQVFPTNAALSVGEPSVKGYLTSTNGTALSNKQINIIIDNATLENGTSIENILVGKTSTDQNGCFYFAEWDQDAIDRFQKDMVEKTPHGAPTDLVSIKAVFTGDSKFQGSSNSTKFTYYTVTVPIIRPALSAFLVNGSDIILEQGKSYNFTDFSTWGEALQLHTLSIEMKNLPCGIYEKTKEIFVGNNQTQVIMPIELRVEKTATVGNFTTYISVNNQALEPINLEIK